MAPAQRSIRSVTKVPISLSVNKLIDHRRYGFRWYNGYGDDLAYMVYAAMDRYSLRSDFTTGEKKHGGIFNLEFSPNGQLLLAACEHECILVYDSSRQKLIQTIDRAHDMCVNCVRFLNNNEFASCSDDNSIKLWDIRNTLEPNRVLHGHANWVKNIEYLPEANTMVTSGFDGSIYAWDLTQSTTIPEKVFSVNGMMRMKLSSDGKKMVISTTGGYLIIIHDLNLSTLSQDLRNFQPLLYRLMQLSGQTFPAFTVFNKLFRPGCKRNRVEFVDDFSIDAEMVSSIQIHPFGWNTVSRFLNRSESDEQTNVHDIQERDSTAYEDAFTYVEEINDNDEDGQGDEYRIIDVIDTGVQTSHHDYFLQNVVGPAEDEAPRQPRPQRVRVPPAHNRSPWPTDLWMAFTPHHEIVAYESDDERAQQNGGGRNIRAIPENLLLPTMGIVTTGMIRMSGQNRSEWDQYFAQHPEDKHRVVRNLPRLTHFIREPNVGRGFIKELAYSPDGRVIASPFHSGVRLLGFSDRCEELTYCVPETPQMLRTLIQMNNYHKHVVACCKFSPVADGALVSGCLGGDVMWYKPVF